MYEQYILFTGVLGQLLIFTQGTKIVIYQSAGDLSLTGFFLSLVSVSSWLLYGILLKNRILIASNMTAVVGVLFVVTGVLIYG